MNTKIIVNEKKEVQSIIINITKTPPKHVIMASTIMVILISLVYIISEILENNILFTNYKFLIDLHINIKI